MLERALTGGKGSNYFGNGKQLVRFLTLFNVWVQSSRFKIQGYDKRTIVASANFEP